VGVLKEGQDDGGVGGHSLERIRTDCRWLVGGRGKGEGRFFKGFCEEVFLLPCVTCVFVPHAHKVFRL
jgi:hypothetical protein